jgi:hypothetical protein
LRTSEDAIRAFISERHADYVTDVRLVEPAETLVLDVPMELVAEVVERGKTSRRQLARLKQDIERRFGVTTLISLRPSKSLAQVEQAVRALLVARYPGVIDDVVMSFVESTFVVAWIVVGSSPGAEIETRILGEAKELLDKVGVSRAELHLVQPTKPAPPIMAILRSVKRLAPVLENDLAEDLERRGMPCPSARWLTSKLDAARKRGWLVRATDGRYALTAEGLEVVPHPRGRASSDIERVLSLARRRTW